jgi:hypothetical protein
LGRERMKSSLMTVLSLRCLVECLPSKCEALSSIPSTTPPQKKKTNKTKTNKKKKKPSLTSHVSLATTLPLFLAKPTEKPGYLCYINSHIGREMYGEKVTA